MGNQCVECKYYIRHYIRRKTFRFIKYTSISFGHCTFPPKPIKYEKDQACERFELAEKEIED